MKYLKFFSEGFHIFEDVRNDNTRERRLNISGHGTVGKLATLDLESKFIDPEKLIAILNRYFKDNLSQYRHVRLLFCHSADRGWYGDSFAARFSRLLANSDQVIVEAYQGVVNVGATNYNEPTRSFEDFSQFDWRDSITNDRNSGMKRVLASDYDINFIHKSLFRSASPHNEGIKTAFWNSVEELESTFETCNPVHIMDILASRIFFCNGLSSRNINDFLDRISKKEQ
ncbi:hypothetical protein Xbed_03162 [Xenorhabdus beddingii]|uniref:Uncharacterized protein n=1 Tax=Xenorhabdus beddingii TaxID=40578 RepID=A0A1Y2SKT7_9GAMM|nr:hypothetical protein [Xenorhabdus beddingii]OTA18166.1 hypothetical protein Xbed_03162 [Xenorhabdus beddingii]